MTSFRWDLVGRARTALLIEKDEAGRDFALRSQAIAQTLQPVRIGPVFTAVTGLGGLCFVRL